MHVTSDASALHLHLTLFGNEVEGYQWLQHKHLINYIFIKLFRLFFSSLFHLKSTIKS